MIQSLLREVMVKARTMKIRLFLLSSLFVSLILLLSSTPTTVFGDTSVTVRGNLNNVVPGPKLVPIMNQPVTVVCGGITKNATTDSNGLYTVSYTESGCHPFSAISTKSDYNGSVLTRKVHVSSEGQATIDLFF